MPESVTPELTGEVSWQEPVTMFEEVHVYVYDVSVLARVTGPSEPFALISTLDTTGGGTDRLIATDSVNVLESDPVQTTVIVVVGLEEVGKNGLPELIVSLPESVIPELSGEVSWQEPGTMLLVLQV